MSGKKFSEVKYSDADINRMIEGGDDRVVYSAEPSYHRGDAWKNAPKYHKCAHKHPPLTFKGLDGKGYTIYGGACGDPVHHDLDIYVALDHGTAHDPKAWPWHGTRQFVYFPISDMSVPKDGTEFKLMIEWVCEQMQAGKTVHVGCIGGHGRTGMVLAAVVKMLGGIEDAITYVRGHYCQKAVETGAQAAWLHTHFNIKSVHGAKDHGHSSSGWGNAIYTAKVPKADTRAKQVFDDFGDKAEVVKPFRITGNIWGMTA